MKKDRKTVAELMAELNSDPEYLVRKNAQEEARDRLRDEMAKAEASLVAALCSAGVDVQSVWDLLNQKVLPAAAIPVLLEHVKERKYPDTIREGMLRALATPEARGHWDELVGFFEHNSLTLPPERRYLAALALHGAADDSVIEDVIRLARNSALGLNRAPLLLTLQRSKNPKAKMLLLNLRDDPDLGKEVKRLRRLERKLS
jgi:hypothetical protein